MDNIPFELFQTRGEATTTVLTVICKLCHSYCTIRLISHPSKVILRVILNELTIKAEKLLAEEQEGFRPGRSTVEQIFNGRVIIEKHLQHQRDPFYNFIDFKTAVDRVRRSGKVAGHRKLQQR